MDAPTQHTPMIEQYLSIKKQYPDHLLFYRMGDFYELFFEDAKKVAALIDITLTSRGHSAGQAVAMAGVPYHAADHYIAKLIHCGQTIAICEQIGEAGLQKGPMHREVVRILTAGTLTDESLLESTSDYPIVAICAKQASYGIAALTLSRGHLELYEAKSVTDLNAEIARLNPVEILVNHPTLLHGQYPKQAVIVLRSQASFDFNPAKHCLTHLEKRATVPPLSLCAVGALLDYVQDTQKNVPLPIYRWEIHQKEAFIQMDAQTRRNLELTQTLNHEEGHTLLNLVNHCSTPMGTRLLKRWIHQPLLSRTILNARFHALKTLITDESYANLQKNLKPIGDMERVLSRIALLSAKPTDLLRLKQALYQIPLLKKELQDLKADLLQQKNNALPVFSELSALLNRALVENPPSHIRDGGVIADGFNADLDYFRKISQNSAKFLAEFEQEQRQKTGLPTLKVGFNQVHGYYIEMSRLQAKQAPSHYQRRQTLKNAERYITPELKAFEDQILSSRQRAIALEKELYQTLLTTFQEFVLPLQHAAEIFSEIDVLCSLAQCSHRLNWCQATLLDTPELYIEAGRHPVVEQTQPHFIPNDLSMHAERQLLFITGPNMGGKSTYMRQTALIILLAHIGCFVPAQSAKIGAFDQIFTRIGAQDDLSSGRSTFMVEMTETAHILQQATSKSFILMDEIGRGTSTFDGLSLAWAIASYLLQHVKACTLFATHYFEMTRLVEHYHHAANIHLRVAENSEDLIFLYTVAEGPANKSYGIQVAKLAGLPNSVIQEALAQLAVLETNSPI